jgi:hypothetical protein
MPWSALQYATPLVYMLILLRVVGRQEWWDWQARNANSLDDLWHFLHSRRLTVNGPIPIREIQLKLECLQLVRLVCGDQDPLDHANYWCG